jgi:hypothetical protein
LGKKSESIDDVLLLLCEPNTYDWENDIKEIIVAQVINNFPLLVFKLRNNTVRFNFSFTYGKKGCGDVYGHIYKI